MWNPCSRMNAPLPQEPRYVPSPVEDHHGGFRLVLADVDSVLRIHGHFRGLGESLASRQLCPVRDQSVSIFAATYYSHTRSIVFVIQVHPNIEMSSLEIVGVAHQRSHRAQAPSVCYHFWREPRAWRRAVTHKKTRFGG